RAQLPFKKIFLSAGASLCAPLSGGDDLDPVSVGICHKIDPHGRILKADAAHGGMLGVGRLIVLCPEGQMEFALPQVILLGMVPQPCQLQAEVRFSI
ncbi:DUF6487 domain-containing protein, partial [Dysosmobacter welbionis]